MLNPTLPDYDAGCAISPLALHVSRLDTAYSITSYIRGATGVSSYESLRFLYYFRYCVELISVFPCRTKLGRSERTAVAISSGQPLVSKAADEKLFWRSSFLNVTCLIDLMRALTFGMWRRRRAVECGGTDIEFRPGKRSDCSCQQFTARRTGG